MSGIYETKLKKSCGKIFSSPAFLSISSAVLCALIGIIVGFIILLIINPSKAGEAIVTILENFLYYDKTKHKLYYFGQTLVKAVPLVLCSLSVLFAYKSGLFNIGVGGQYCVGIGVSLWCALAWHMPWWGCVLFAMAAAAVWGAVSGVFKALFNVNEVIACIMMNWIGLYLVNVLMQGEKIMDQSKSETFMIRVVSPGSILPSLGLGELFSKNQYVTIAIPLMIIVAVVIHIVLSKTTFGYELRATGLNKNAAKYAGMKDKVNIIITMAISGALAGLAASLYYLTDLQQWKTSSAVPAMGFNGIAVAFLGGLNPIGVIFAGYFIQHITVGGSLLKTQYFTPQIADLISSIIIYSCAFVLFFKEIISRLGKKKSSDEPNVNAGTSDAQIQAVKAVLEKSDSTGLTEGGN